MTSDKLAKKMVTLSESKQKKQKLKQDPILLSLAHQQHGRGDDHHHRPDGPDLVRRPQEAEIQHCRCILIQNGSSVLKRGEKTHFCVPVGNGKKNDKFMQK